MLYIILGIIMVFFAWMQAAFGKMQKFKNEARTQWVRVDALLQTRSHLILKILELADEFEVKERDLLAEIYELEGGYCKSNDREVVSECAEKITPLLDRMLQLIDQYPQLADNEEFRELKEDLLELEDEIDVQSSHYNKFINLYNSHLANPSLRLQFAILGAPVLKGLHIRPENVSEDSE